MDGGTDVQVTADVSITVPIEAVIESAPGSKPM